MVRQALSIFATIPAAYKKLRPAPDLSVNAFISLGLPMKQHALTAVTATDLYNNCFSKELPNWDIPSSRCIPLRSHVKRLEDLLEQESQSQAQSFIDKRFQGNNLLPLWTLTWWKEMDEVIMGQRLWREVIAWLREGTKGQFASDVEAAMLIDEVRVLLDELAWNETMSVLREDPTTNTLLFWRLLSYLWLNDLILNMLITELFQFEIKRAKGTKDYNKTLLDNIKLDPTRDPNNEEIDPHSEQPTSWSNNHVDEESMNDQHNIAHELMQSTPQPNNRLDTKHALSKAWTELSAKIAVLEQLYADQAPAHHLNQAANAARNTHMEYE
ncbi:hypothetical protein M422DRAFT_253539 [Sphaerobolus stellatus SS14]|uniref:Uncharacterized protein n=1 Tax=Sphaerobolus stellatus (strain SS14) TaxID=990650 RepID=A0A0C9VY05_SPHS4|nr:hypothetical protein M422DRAFT_253539 [Sphaerobolus stellatus SS14]